MPRKCRPSSSESPWASTTASAGALTPHLSWPTFTSMSTPSRTPSPREAAASTSADCSESTTAVTLQPRRAIAARRRAFAGAATWFDSKMSPTASAMATASETFWQQTPTVPGCCICRMATSTVLWLLTCGRSATSGKLPRASAILWMLASSASSSTTSAGVSTSSRHAPAEAGGAGGLRATKALALCPCLLKAPGWATLQSRPGTSGEVAAAVPAVAEGTRGADAAAAVLARRRQGREAAPLVPMARRLNIARARLPTHLYKGRAGQLGRCRCPG
mmetsp:Transcript_137929/g.384659  ORF Transcript_137929/g.384659 Transcript_137929/m.384659 type:complete len:276 (+) Transcript_137929:718-1545(+)